jgi:mannose/fructose/N-acetylgalactosamine-specific phosphotransferase system component IIC
MAFVDAHMVLAAVGTAIVGGIIGLDRTAVGQFMISQPIVAGPFVGWMLGDATTGLLVGAALELIWILDMPVGSFVPADSTVAAISATAIAILGSPGDVHLPVAGFSILLTVILAPITMIADQVARQFNSRLAHAALSASGPDLRKRLGWSHVSGVGVFFLKSLVVYLVFIPVGIVIVRLFHGMPDPSHRAMALFIKLLPLIGAALAARKLSMKAVDLFLLGGFAIAALMGLVFQAPAVVVLLLAVAGGWLGAGYRARWS